VILKYPPYNQVSLDYAAGMRIGLTVVYLICALLFFFPCLYLYRFSVKMKLALASVSQENFDTSLQNLKSLLKFYGILTIVMLSIYALIFILVMLAMAVKS
jgi:hypothetical protein